MSTVEPGTRRPARAVPSLSRPCLPKASVLNPEPLGEAQVVTGRHTPTPFPFSLRPDAPHPRFSCCLTQRCFCFPALPFSPPLPCLAAAEGSRGQGAVVGARKWEKEPEQGAGPWFLSSHGNRRARWAGIEEEPS